MLHIIRHRHLADLAVAIHVLMLQKCRNLLHIHTHIHIILRLLTHIGFMQNAVAETGIILGKQKPIITVRNV